MASPLTGQKLDLDDIQGDVLEGLQKNAEFFIFFKIADVGRFKTTVKRQIVGRLTSARRVHQQQLLVERRRRQRQRARSSWAGLNLAFTRHGMTRLLGADRPPLDPAFERGADHPETIALLNDPPAARWLPGFLSDRIDGLFLLTGLGPAFVEHQRRHLLEILGSSIKVVYAEMGQVRPGAQRGHEHFGFRDGISRPGIRGLTRRSRPGRAPDEGLPGQDLVWPGEFVFGYPGADPRDRARPGAVLPLPAPWARNGSFMVFRRLEQRVPEFRSFVATAAARLGIAPDLLAARMVGRWPSGAPLELAPRYDNALLGGDPARNNDFGYADDPFQRACPYAAHIRKMNPRDDVPGGRAEAGRHRIIRTGIPFGPEVAPGEARTAHSRGTLFVCYQIAIARQFEYLQSRVANDPGVVGGKLRPAGGGAVAPGYDPIVGQAPAGARCMDEPVPNYPFGNRRSALAMPEPFTMLTAAAYLFVPSVAALRTALT